VWHVGRADDEIVPLGHRGDVFGPEPIIDR
jgi:hypothetical protein